MIAKQTPEAFDVLVEIPAGSRNKYEMDKVAGRMRLDRTLFTSTCYPADYGYVEDTLALDGDPIDALILLNEPTFPGCLVRVRAVGLYRMSDEQGPDEKLICVPADDARWNHVQDIEDVSHHLRAELGHFFEIYKALEPGKHVLGTAWEGRHSAYAELAFARSRYTKS